MRSPFPGMDPYLEQRWGDFHAALVTYIRDALQPGLPDDLRARMEERVFVEELGAPARQYVPDVHVYEPPRKPPTGSTALVEAPPQATAEPFLLQATVELTERYLEIIDVRSGGRVVTVIEVLSPSN